MLHVGSLLAHYHMIGNCLRIRSISITSESPFTETAGATFGAGLVGSDFGVAAFGTGAACGAELLLFFTS